MKRIAVAIPAALISLCILGSCGSKKKKVEEFADKVIVYVDANSLDSLRTVYPFAIFDSIAFAEFNGVEVSQGEKNLWRVDLGKDTWLDVMVHRDGELVIVESNGIAAFPKENYDLAVATGLISSNMTDVEKQNQMNDTLFFAWMQNKAMESMNDIVSISHGQPRTLYGVDLLGRPCEGSVVKLAVTVTNNSDKPVSGSDYSIGYTYSVENCSDGSIPPSHLRDAQRGIDLASGASGTINIAKFGYNLRNVAVNYNMSKDDYLKNQFKPTGKEYEEYLKSKK